LHSAASGGAIKEFSIKQCLKEFTIHHIKQIVHDIMMQYSIDQDKWFNKLFEFVRTAVEQVQPSSRRLNDPMDFTHFIKIKIINWMDNSKSAYVNGIVMSKNIADKRMQ
jgi:1-phosphatidylinositol-3-phosphate 5-kinase